MTPADENGRDANGDDMLAAEYVLGALPADERLAAARRLASDPAFAALVERWEARLAPMASDYAEAAPPASVKAALDRRLFSGAEAATAKAGLWHSLAFWRGLAAAAVAALVLYAVFPYLQPPVGETPEVQFVASLAGEGSDVRYVALYDPAHKQVDLSHVSGARAEGRDFELWIIEGDNPPVSLGVIPVGETVHLVLSPELQRRLAAGAVLAISLEPAGGSPTGQPTGPVVATGEIKNI